MLKQGYFYHSKIGNSFNSLYCDLYFKSDYIEYVIRDYFSAFLIINKKYLSMIFKDYPNKISSFENFEILENQEIITKVNNSELNEINNEDFVKIFIKDLRVYNDIKKRYSDFVLYKNLSLDTIYFFLKEIVLFNYYEIDIEKHPVDNVYELGRIKKLEKKDKPILSYKFIDFIYDNNILTSFLFGSNDSVDLYTIKKPLDIGIFKNYYFDKPEKEELKEDFNFYALEDINSLLIKFIEVIKKTKVNILLFEDKNKLLQLRKYILSNSQNLSNQNYIVLLREIANFLKQGLFYAKLTLDFESFSNSKLLFHDFQDIPYIKIYSESDFSKKIELFVKKINFLYSFKINIKNNNIIFTLIDIVKNFQELFYESIEQFLINFNQLTSNHFNPFLNYIEIKFFYNKVNSKEYYDFYKEENNKKQLTKELLYKNKEKYLNNNFEFEFDSYLDSKKIISLLNENNLFSYLSNSYFERIKSILSFIYEELNSSFKDPFNLSFHFENKFFEYKNNHIAFLNCLFNESKLNKYYDTLKTYGNNIQFLNLKHFLLKTILEYNLSFKNIKTVSSNENSKDEVMYNTKKEFIFILKNATFIIKKEQSYFISFLKNLFYIYEKINLSSNENLNNKKFFYEILINHFQAQLILSFTSSDYKELINFILFYEHKKLFDNYNKQHHFLFSHNFNFFSFASCELLPNINYMKDINSTIHENHGDVYFGKVNPYLYYSQISFRKKSSNFEIMDLKKVFHDKYNQIEFIFLNIENFNLFKQMYFDDNSQKKFFKFMRIYFEEIFSSFNYLN